MTTKVPTAGSIPLGEWSIALLSGYATAPASLTRDLCPNDFRYDNVFIGISYLGPATTAPQGMAGAGGDGGARGEGP